jgi:probable HAF family extracellular repeat protein
MRTKIAIVIGWFAVQGTLGLQPHAASAPAVLDNQGLSRSAITGGRDNPTANLLSRLWTDGAPGNGTGLFQAGGDRTEIATLSTLPSLDRTGSEALAVNEAGTVIVGYSWARLHGGSLQHAVKWTLQNGSWAISSLPDAATEAVARGINNQGDATGDDSSPPSPSHPILWPATGGFEVLGCNDNDVTATVYGISAVEQIVVGQRGFSGATAAVWQPGNCRVDLPPLIDGGAAGARAVNRDGAIVGGIAAISSDRGVPVRWMSVSGQWQIEQLDNRPGEVRGANGIGDLAGSAYVPCASPDGCQRAVIWYAAGGSEDLDTLGGKDSWALDINATREVVGGSTASNGVNTAFFWSESLGMLQLPFKGRWATANAVSDVRPDGTRLIVGQDWRGNAVAWVVRNP